MLSNMSNQRKAITNAVFVFYYYLKWCPVEFLTTTMEKCFEEQVPVVFVSCGFVARAHRPNTHSCLRFYTIQQSVASRNVGMYRQKAGKKKIAGIETRM